MLTYDVVLRYLGGLLSVIALGAFAANAAADTPSFVAPPRTTADISAILEREKPDPERIANQQAKANAVRPDTSDRRVLAQFYFERAEMRGRLGRVHEAVADIEQSINYAQGLDALLGRSLLLLGQLYGWAGDTKHSLEAFTRAESLFKPDRRYNVTRWIGIDWIALGNLDQAERYMQANREALAKAETRDGWPTDPFRSTAEAHVEFGNAAILEVRGQFRQAAEAYERAEERFRDSLTKLSDLSNPPIRTSVEQVVYWMAARAARVKARDGRLTEAEVDVRRALLGWLKLSGKYDLNTARIIDVFALILVEQGRFAEAETLARTVLDIYRELGTERDSQVAAISLNRLAGILALQGKWADAAAMYATLDAATSEWEESRKDEIEVDVTRIVTYYQVNQPDRAIAAAKRLIARQVGHYGEKHPETALARGMLAIGLSRAGDETEALREFKTTIPILLGSRDALGDEDDAIGAAAREQRVQDIVESYMALLARGGGDGPSDSFQLAESIRGQSVQKALQASAVRALAGNPAIAELARREQDLSKQAAAQLGLLSNTLALAPGQRDDRAINTLRSEIDRLRREHTAAQREIVQKFPDYAALVDPRPPTVEQTRRTLKDDEALLSFYFGRDEGFVWAIAKDAPLGFAVIPRSARAIDETVKTLRQALEAEAATIGDIPAFDLSLAHELYTVLLKPVRATWRPAKSLIVETNGALGLLPLGLLPTAPAQLDQGAAPLFSGYRKVLWLARTHAVTMVPSAAALLTLRQLPPGSLAREKLIGFGDPYFSAAQAAEAAQQKNVEDGEVHIADAATTRGVALRRRSVPQTANLNEADLGMLPRLPDTAAELRSIAVALGADPAKVLHLGKDANEHEVETIDLTRYKIVAFATHGLLPGDLDGLTQPALALTAPSVAGIGGDGLLTMAKILSLKLNADWVVLSACNSGAGANVDGEAASGLGRAFFYAGSRAILLTNWSVHSVSARELVANLFRRQAANTAITRAEALRRAMVSMIENGGYKDDAGKTVFTYAHPLFWAPYSIIGDGG